MQGSLQGLNMIKLLTGGADSQKMKADAQKQIEEERESSVRAAKEEIASLQQRRLQSLLSQYHEEDNRNLLDEFLMKAVINND
jgi:hypothetical protein